MKSEEQDQLWQLMGKAKQPTVSPFFARNILREIRLSQQEKPGVLAWLRRNWRVVSLASCAATAAALAAFAALAPQPAPLSAPSAQLARVETRPHDVLVAEIAKNQGDIEVIAHLDELVAYEENSIWTDNNAE